MELYIVNGVCGGTSIQLPDVPTVLGRSPESHVQVGDPWISSMHALFERRGDDLWVVDLDSRNGTFVDDDRVHEARIAPGCRLRFGKTAVELRLRTAPTEEPSVLSDQRTILRYLSDVAGDGAPGVTGLGPRSGGTGTYAAAAARRQASVLNEIARALITTPDLGPALDRLLRLLTGAVRSERSCVLLMDAAGELTPCVAVPPDQPPGRSSTLINATLRTRAGILTLDARRDARFAASDSVVAQGLQSCISAPIWTESHILGVLQLERGFVHPFTAEDLELATLVGFQAAVAVERARQDDRVRQVAEGRRELQRLLGAAHAAPHLAPEASPPAGPALRPQTAVVAAVLDGVAPLAAATSAAEAGRRALALQRALVEAAQAEGAAVDAHLDGGLVAVIDLLGSREEPAARAHRCACALLDRAREVEGARPAPRLGLRVGLACGPALVGNFGAPDRTEPRVVGEAPQAAWRRALAAAPGELRDADERI